MEVLCAANACLDLIIYRVGSGQHSMVFSFSSSPTRLLVWIFRSEPDHWSKPDFSCVIFGSDSGRVFSGYRRRPVAVTPKQIETAESMDRIVVVSWTRIW